MRRSISSTRSTLRSTDADRLDPGLIRRPSWGEPLARGLPLDRLGRRLQTVSTLEEIRKIRKRFEDENLGQRFNDLVAIGEKPGPEAAQKRGRDFEALFLDLLDAHGLLLRRSYHTADDRSEQIDGALEISGRVTLVEAKWVESGIAASELFAFLGKVEGKFVGTIGIFVSYVELSSNFINALRAGRRQSILVLHGPDDIRRVFDPAFPLQEYLEECLRHVSIDNLPHLAASSYADKRAQSKRAERAYEKADLRTLLDQLASPATSPAALAAGVAAEKLEASMQALIDVFPKVLTLASSEPLRSRIPNYIAVGVGRLEQKELPLDEAFFRERFPTTILEPAFLPLVSAFVARLPFVSHETRESVGRVLIAAWEENLGTYEKENILAAVTELLWSQLSPEAKSKLFGWFIHFVNSDRRLYFPQMQLARARLTDATDKQIRDDVLRKLVESELRSMLKHDDNVAWARKWIARSFENVLRLLPEAEMDALFDEVETELVKTGDYKSSTVTEHGNG